MFLICKNDIEKKLSPYGAFLLVERLFFFNKFIIIGWQSYAGIPGRGELKVRAVK